MHNYSDDKQTKWRTSARKVLKIVQKVLKTPQQLYLLLKEGLMDKNTLWYGESWEKRTVTKIKPGVLDGISKGEQEQQQNTDVLTWS
jgi:hypothetical protein